MANQRRGLGTSTTLTVLCLLSAGAAAQEKGAAEPAPVPIVSTTTLNAIRFALANPPAINVNGNGLRFQMQVIARQRTFADYLRGTDISFGRAEPFNARKVLGGGGRGGFDVLPLIVAGVNKAKAARRAYLVRKINEQIDRELEALAASRSEPVGLAAEKPLGQ